MKNFLGKALTITVFLLAIGVGKYLGLAGLLFFAAFYIGRWLGKKLGGKSSLKNFISWSNLISWFLPPLGVFTASFAYEIYTSEKDKTKNKFRNLAIIGGVLSAVNALLGILQRL